MTSKEIIKRLIRHDTPPRFGFDFSDRTDLVGYGSRRYIDLPDNPYDVWGKYPELEKLTGFNGETRRDMFGNIYGRFEGKTKGECIRGAIQDWENYSYPIPKFDPAYREELLQKNLKECDQYVFVSGGFLFSALRDARLITNALADTITDPDAVVEFMGKVSDHEVAVIKSLAGCGIDGWFLGDDWGTQDRTLISPESFRELFKGAYKKVCDAAHEAGMDVIMHSCGYNYAFIEDLIDAGMDGFQFDQPDVYPTEVLAKEFAKKVVFHSPVDIQKILPTGNRELIESRALEMCRLFREAGGGWIAKDYPSYQDIGIDPVWAKWAEDVIIENCNI